MKADVEMAGKVARRVLYTRVTSAKVGMIICSPMWIAEVLTRETPVTKMLDAYRVAQAHAIGAHALRAHGAIRAEGGVREAARRGARPVGVVARTQLRRRRRGGLAADERHGGRLYEYIVKFYSAYRHE